MDDILSLALESSGIPSSQPGTQDSRGPSLSLEALFGVPSGPGGGTMLATTTSNPPPVQGRRLDSVGSSGQSTATSEFHALDVDPFATAPFNESKKFSLEEVLDVVLNEPRGSVVEQQSNNLTPLFDSSSSLAMDANLNPELDMALNAALFGSTELPSTSSESPHDTFLSSHNALMPQIGRQTSASAVTLPSVARSTVAVPSPLVHSTFAPRQLPHSAMGAPLRSVSQPAAITGGAASSSQTPGFASSTRLPL